MKVDEAISIEFGGDGINMNRYCLPPEIFIDDDVLNMVMVPGIKRHQVCTAYKLVGRECHKMFLFRVRHHGSYAMMVLISFDRNASPQRFVLVRDDIKIIRVYCRDPDYN